jgi:hypothetical protein
MARPGYRMLSTSLAVAAGIVLTASADAKSATVSCASYQGPPATWAKFTHVKAEGISCTLAEKLVRAMYSPDYATKHDLVRVGPADQHVVFRIAVQDEHGGSFTLSLVGQPPKYGGDTVSMHGAVPLGAPDPTGHQTS